MTIFDLYVMLAHLGPFEIELLEKLDQNLFVLRFYLNIKAF
jgi:hypothetical protein